MTLRYGLPAIILHWLTAIAIVAGFTLGLTMVDMRFSPTKLQLYSYHKWIGVTVFLMAVLRVAWRISHPPPAPLPGQPAWQRRSAATAHAMLYVLLFAVPVSGWLYSSASGVPTVYLGLIPLPDAVGRDAALKDVLKGVHYWLTMLLAALVAVHVLAALKHAIVDRDGTLRRMLPGPWRTSPTPKKEVS